MTAITPTIDNKVKLERSSKKESHGNKRLKNILLASIQNEDGSYAFNGVVPEKLSFRDHCIICEGDLYFWYLNEPLLYKNCNDKTLAEILCIPQGSTLSRSRKNKGMIFITDYDKDKYTLLNLNSSYLQISLEELKLYINIDNTQDYPKDNKDLVDKHIQKPTKKNNSNRYMLDNKILSRPLIMDVEEHEKEILLSDTKSDELLRTKHLSNSKDQFYRSVELATDLYMRIIDESFYKEKFKLSDYVKIKEEDVPKKFDDYNLIDPFFIC